MLSGSSLLSLVQQEISCLGGEWVSKYEANWLCGDQGWIFPVLQSKNCSIWQTWEILTHNIMEIYIDTLNLFIFPLSTHA